MYTHNLNVMFAFGAVECVIANFVNVMFLGCVICFGTVVILWLVYVFPRVVGLFIHCVIFKSVKAKYEFASCGDDLRRTFHGVCV